MFAGDSCANSGLKASSAGGSIDWASLAQQWIQMRDFSGADINSAIPDAPPPPKISVNLSAGIKTGIDKPSLDEERFEEQGEADMEMDDDEDGPRSMHNQIYLQTDVSANPHLQTEWMTQNAAVPLVNSYGAVTNAAVPQETTQWEAWPPAPLQREGARSHIPSLMNINVPDPNIYQRKLILENQNDKSAVSVMDAAKRKILPAWIREGLEKMEREKQKQLEKQNVEGYTTELNHCDASYLSSLDTVNNKDSSILEIDNSVNEDDVCNDAVAAISNTPTDVEDKSAPKVDALNSSKSYEHRLSDLMVVVRKTLTELLLEVTNEEIEIISLEAIKSHKTKASTAQVIPKSAISTITGKLGLAAYEDSCSNSSGSETDESSKDGNLLDSEEEIKASLRAKRKAFSKISEEIEEHIAESALREEYKLKYYTQQELQQYKEGNQLEPAYGTSSINRHKPSVSGTEPSTHSSDKGYEKDFGETSDSKLQPSNGKRQKERTTRFSDNKDSRVVSAAEYIMQMKSNHIDTSIQKSNSALLQIQVDSSIKFNTPFKSIDQTPNIAKAEAERGLGTVSNIEINSKRHATVTSHTSDNVSSSSDDSTASDTSNSTRSSSKQSRSSFSKHSSRSSFHRTSSAFSTRRSGRYHTPNKSDDRKSSRHRYNSSESDCSEERHSKKHRKRRSSYYRDYHQERRTRRSRSRSRSKSSYSSRCRH